MLEEPGAYSLADALSSYRVAVDREPNNPDAYEAIGYFVDAVEDNPREAEQYFRMAITLGGGKSARKGLAQVLKQLNETD